MTEGDTMLEELVDTLEAPGKRDRPDHEWIRGGTWALIDERASRRKQGTLTQAQGRRLSRRIRQALKQDRRERARKAGEEIMGALADGSSKRAYGILRAWHKQCDPAASKPCYNTLEAQTREREALYRRRPPPGDPIPSRAERPPLSDRPPTDEELR